MKRIYLALSVALLAALFTTACAEVFSGRTVTTTGGTAAGNLEEAETAYSQGRYQEAALAYEQYLGRNPEKSRLEPTLAAWGLSAEKAGLYQQAITAYSRLNEEFPEGRFGAEAKYRLGDIYLLDNQPDKAVEISEKLLASETDPIRQAEIRLTMAQGQWSLKRYPEAAANFLQAWSQGGSPVKSAAALGLEATLPYLNGQSLYNLQRQYGRNYPGPEATYVLAWQAARLGDKNAAQAQIDYYQTYFGDHRLNREMSTLAAALAGGSAVPDMILGRGYVPKPEGMSPAVAPAGSFADLGDLSGLSGQVNIAAMLPLSGESGRYAQNILNGLKLAVTKYSGSGGLGLKIMDTGGSGDAAGRLVNQAAGQDDVLAVVGPFLSREVQPAAQAAQSAGLPLVAITQREGLPSIGSCIFRVFLTPQAQAEAVARYAIRVQGHETFGILYPDDGYGQSMRRFFEAEATRLGGRITSTDSYSAQAKNWGEAVARLTGGSAGRKVSTSYQANTGFTAMYLPDSASAVAQILPLLAFHDVTKMQYLGSPYWLNQALLADTGRYLQGAVIPTALSELSQRPETSRFIAEYTRTYGRTPDQLAAYGYDAGLALVQAFTLGAATRSELARALTQMGQVAGATGPFRFDQTGEYQIEPALLTVEGKDFLLLREPEAYQ